MIMVEHHISMGPVVGSSGGKNIFTFLPTLLGIIQTFFFYSASKISQKTNRILLKKTTIHFRKNPIQKNAIFFFFSVLVCVFTLTCVAGNPNNSGRIGKNQKNKIFCSEIFPSENKNSKIVKFVIHHQTQYIPPSFLNTLLLRHLYSN